MSRLIDAEAVVQYLRNFRCVDCDRRKGLKNGKIRFCYEIGDAPCRACDIGDTIEYFLDEDIAPTVDVIPVEWLNDKASDKKRAPLYRRYAKMLIDEWQKEQEGR